MVNPFRLALIFASMSAALSAVTTQFVPCPDGWLAVGPTGDCVLLSKPFHGNYSQAEEKCRSLGNKDYHMIVLRDFLFSKQLEEVLNKNTADVNNSDTFWIAASRSPIDKQIVWLNDAYIDGSHSLLPVAPKSSASTVVEVGYLSLTLDTKNNHSTGKLDGSIPVATRTLRLNFENSGNKVRRALCARQSFVPSLPAATVKMTGGFCPKISANISSTATVHYISNRCYVVIEGNADHACNKLAPSYRPAAIIDWTAQQVATILADRYQLVIGLRFVNDQGWSWNDQAENVSVLMTSWSGDEPKSGDNCVAIGNGTAMWNSLACHSNSTNLRTLCEARTSESATIPVTSDSAKFVSGSVNCTPGFTAYDSSCYYLGSTAIGNSSASDWCFAYQNASSLWIDRPAELAFVSLLGVQSSKRQRHYALNNVVPFHAGWLELPDSLPVSNGVCLALSSGNGGLTTKPACADLLPACRTPEQNIEIKTKSDASKSLFPTCQKDWILSHDKKRCLKLSPTTSDWRNAKTACQILSPSASLASLHSSIDSVIAKRLLFKAEVKNTVEAWLGFSVRRSSGLLYPEWTDSTLFDFLPSGVVTNRSGSQPAFQCAYVQHDKHEGLLWRLTTQCGTQKRYAMCQIEPSLEPVLTSKAVATTATTLSLIVSSSTVPNSVPVTAKPSFSQSCKSVSLQRLSEDGKRCYSYRLITNPLPWFDALAACRNGSNGNRSSLASIESTEENEYLRKLASASELIWIGLNEALSQVPDQLTTWTDGKPVQYVNFDSRESQIFGQCTALMTSAAPSTSLASSLSMPISGRWYVQNCVNPLPAVCKTIVSEMPQDSGKVSPSSPAVISYCPPDWISSPDNTTCYRLLDKPATFENARRNCQSLGGDLASYQTIGQHDFLTSLLARLGKRAGLAWIGLKWDKHAFNWLDHSRLEHLIWPPVPELLSTDCLAIRYHPSVSDSGYQVPETCALPLPAICRIKRVFSSPARPSNELCKTGYLAFNNTWCYRFSKPDSPANFSAAQAECQHEGAQLLWFDSSFEVHFVRSLAAAVRNPPPADIWFDLKTDKAEITELLWTTSRRPVRFDYLLSEWRHYNLDNLNGCYGYRLYNRVTPAAMGLNRISNGPAEQCSIKKSFVCKALANGVASSSPASTANEIGCYSASNRYAGNAASTISGHKCVRWDLVRLIHEIHTDGFLNATVSSRAVQLAQNPYYSGAAEDTNNFQETLGEAASYCRSLWQLGSNNGLATGVGQPACFYYSKTLSKSGLPMLDMEYCNVPVCPGQGTSLGVLTAIVLVSACGVAVVGVLGFCIWKRGRWAAGYRPQLNLDTGGGGSMFGGISTDGGTSFHNPIYMPANC